MIVTDNSLCNIDISEKADEKNIHEYIVSLFESGIDIAEIDFKTYNYLKDINTSKRFIIRADNPGDLLLAQLKEFYYIVVPYDMLCIAEKLKKSSYLVEVDGDKYDTDRLLEVCRDISQRDISGAIRIVKNFDTDTGELSDFIDRYYAEFTLPLDICPLNVRLTGLNAAYEAFQKGVNMITLGFSASCVYTPYELFVMYFPESFRLHPQAALIPFLLICAARYNLVTDGFNSGLHNIVNVLDTYKKPIRNADSYFLDQQYYKRAAAGNREAFEAFSSAQNSLFRENDFDLDFSACKKLAEVLDSSDMILYNRFFNKDDLLKN